MTSICTSKSVRTITSRMKNVSQNSENCNEEGVISSCFRPILMGSNFNISSSDKFRKRAKISVVVLFRLHEVDCVETCVCVLTMPSVPLHLRMLSAQRSGLENVLLPYRLFRWSAMVFSVHFSHIRTASSTSFSIVAHSRRLCSSRAAGHLSKSICFHPGFVFFVLRFVGGFPYRNWHVQLGGRTLNPVFLSENIL